jgi:HAMP domain-containing protein
MRLRREVGLGLGAILALQLLVSSLAIALLDRMGPAIERILKENVYSGEAVEEMLAELAASPQGAPTEAFTKALGRAQDNVTEEAERAPLALIAQRHGAAFGGDAAARAQTVAALRQLGQVNRDSMARVDLQAQRLGQAGAWAAAILGAFALALGTLVYRRLRLRLELPIDTLRQTTQRLRAGNAQARCPSLDAPAELQQVAADLNWLLDRWLREVHALHPQGPREEELYRLLHWLLDQSPAPLVVLDARDRRVAANRAALDLEGEPDAARWRHEPLSGTSLRLARLDELAPAPTELAPEP